MDQAAQKKIVIIEPELNRRNRLRAMVSAWGFVPFSFEKEIDFLDNMRLLSPHLVIFCPQQIERASRLLNAVNLAVNLTPVVLISNDMEIRNLFDSNDFSNVSLVWADMDPLALATTVQDTLRNHREDCQDVNCPVLIGNSSQMARIKQNIPGLNGHTDPLLIQGEAGTGKELLARVIHHRSGRRQNPFVKIGATALVKDSCAGNGVFKAAHTGTLFIDELGRLPALLQAELLQFLETGNGFDTPFERSDRPDVRIIASTCASLDNGSANGDFRRDLYYRLSVLRIEMPPLRERQADIPQLIGFFADKFCFDIDSAHFDLNDLGRNLPGNYPWPGNVRELESLVRTAIFRGDENFLTEQILARSHYYQRQKLSDPFVDIDNILPVAEIRSHIREMEQLSLKDICREYVWRAEKIYMQKALDSTNWNRKKAAGLLNISYKSLLNKIKEYNLS